MTLDDGLQTTFLGNTLLQYLICGAILLVGFALKRFISRLLNGLAFRLIQTRVKEVSEEEFHALLIKPVERLLLLITLYLAFNVLNYPLDPNDLSGQEPRLKLLFFHGWQFFLIWSAATIVLRLVDFAALIFLKRSDAHVTRMDNQLIVFAKDAVRVLVWFGAAMIVLNTVFSYDVRAFVAGLGIGGLALAFAAKETVENLLASFTIFLDRPFTMGELVTVGDVSGTIEKIGFRSTRIRTAEKSYVTMPNKMMIDRPLNNLSRRPSRRVRFDLSFTYETSGEQLAAIVRQVEDFIQRQPKVVATDTIVRFNSLTAAAKVIYIEYFIATESYTEYLDVVQAVNYEITRIVPRVGATFANTLGAELRPGEINTTDSPPPSANQPKETVAAG
ncbi:MAG: mechanosensitive ion channel family protein [Hymenobacteraceae bacterium]|nr:mechanosensitive ion channel family protein [Hymenobacteraceae bacterium]